MGDHEKYRRQVREAKEKSNTKYKENSKSRLKTLVEKKFTTVIIGALAKFEERFGEIWGHGEYEEDMTESQKKQGEMWEMVRTDILNNGNAQMRAAMNEIDQYTMTWDRYQTDFIIRNQGDNYER